MLTKKGTEAKKEAILEFLSADDFEKGFNLNREVLWVLQSDPKLFLSAVKLLDQKMHLPFQLYQIAWDLRVQLLDLFKEDRELTMRLIRTYISRQASNNLVQYFYQPIDC